MKRVTEWAHDAVRAVVRPGETVVDATAGNGHDTLFLANCVQPGGHVYGFDVQEEAVAKTRARLTEAGMEDVWLHLIHGGHEEMAVAVEGPVAAVMFNLGYLPGGDRSLTTGERSTLAALEQAVRLLRPGGVISVVCYRGHPGGAEEAEAVDGYAKGLEGVGVSVLGKEQSEDGPFLLVVTKGERAVEGPSGGMALGLSASIADSYRGPPFSSAPNGAQARRPGVYPGWLFGQSTPSSEGA